MRIQNNMMAINTHRQLSVNQTNQAKSTEKLSSGFRINRAADDAAGLTISEKMRAQIRGLNRASANAQDGISMIQAAEGALQESHSILQRMRELAVQGANDVNAAEDRGAIKDEIDQLGLELDRIATTTNFNGKYVLSGLYADQNSPYALDDYIPDQVKTVTGLDEGVGALNIQVGANTLTSDVIKINFSGVTASALLNGAADGLMWVTPTGNDAGTVINYENKANEGYVPSVSSSELDGEDVAQLDTGEITTFGFQALVNVIDGKNADGTALDASNPKTGIALVNELRSTLGSVQNRLEHTVANVDTVAENMQSAESRIRDVDMAKEMMAFTKNNILNQAATAMLAQANQAPQTVLSLIR